MDFTKRTNWTVRLLYLQAAFSVIAVISGTLEHGVLRDIQDGNFAAEAEMMQAAEASDARQRIVGILQLLLYVGSGIWILRWIYVACSNARSLAAGPMEFSPGWSVGWYFIPFLSLWKPYQAMKEIWRVSANPGNPDIGADSGLLPLWWTLYLVASLSGNAALRLSLRAEGVGQLLATNVMTQISDVVDIPLAIVFMVMVRRIHDNQELARSKVNAPEPENTATATA